MYKRGMLALGQRQVELIHNTLVADGGEQAQADIADTVFAVQHGRNRHVGIDAGEDALYDMADGNGNRIERCALALDDVAAGLAHVILNVRIVERRNQHAVGVFHSLLVCVCRNVGDVRNGPRHEGAVAVLTQNVSVYVLLVDLVVLGETCTQTGGIEDGTGTEDAGLRNAGALAERIGEDINRVADEQIDCIRCILRDVRRDALDDVDVRLCKVQSGLAGLTGNAGRDDDDVGILCVFIAARVNGTWRAERNALTDVQSLALCLFLVDIDHDNLGSNALHSEGVSDRGADAAAADNGNFIHSSNHPFFSIVAEFWIIALIIVYSGE